MRAIVNKYVSRKFLLLLFLLPWTQVVLAQNNGPARSSISNPLVLTMVIIMLILLLAIGLLAYVLQGAATWHYEREKATAKKEEGSAATKITTVVLLLLAGTPLFAQDASPVTEAVQATSSIGGLSPTAFYCMIGVVALELIVIFVLLYQLQLFVAKEKARHTSADAASQPKRYQRIWEKLNNFKPVDQEAQVDTGHEYDGIRELDNRLPPWWLYGFYLTIVVGVIYLWRYHVSETAPLSEQEYQIAMQQAEEEKAAYLKKSANNVDENTMKLITDVSVLASAQTVFQQNCAACHGKAGEGMVGPNLTDDYWLHGGSVQDVFKTIKYGVPEKGMRSWKDDLSPAQIAQVASYIKNLHGTNPPNAKEKQGELYQENKTADSATQAAAVAQ